MTMREFLFRLENEEGEPIYLLRTLVVWLSGRGLGHMIYHDFKVAEVPDFYFSCAKMLNILWEEVLSQTSARLLGMEGFSEDEVLEECNRVINKLRDALSQDYDLILPDYSIHRVRKH